MQSTDHKPGHDQGEQAHPEVLTALDGLSLKNALSTSVAWLEKHIDVINALNVFPVPDGDTGTNMFLTMKAAMEETAGLADNGVANVMGAVAHGALMGARGNSGVILSQVLRGMARALAQSQELDAQGLADALMEGSKTAYKGVIKPVEGTILTVARETADAVAKAAPSHHNLLALLDLAVQEAAASVERTPTLLIDLREAGVVDSGGQGFLVILEGILLHLRGQELGQAPQVGSLAAPTPTPAGEYGYEALFILSGADLPVEQIRSTMMSMGDSVLVVGDDHALKVHVHTGRPGAVLDYAISMGQISDVVIENLQEQTSAFMAPNRAQAKVTPDEIIPVAAESMANVAIVAVASGQGMQEVFRSLGASAVINGGQTTNPSTQELLGAINGLLAENVIILPNNSNVIMAAQQAKELASKNVRVVPTKTMPQGISALLAFNYQAAIDTNVELMDEAATQIQTAEITMAVRSAQVNGLKVQGGHVIGLLNGDLVAAGEEMQPVIEQLLELMDAENCDIITIYYGDSVSQEEAEAVAQHIETLYPGPEIEVISGGQPYYQYIISAE